RTCRWSYRESACINWISEYPYDWEKDSTKPDENGGTNVVSEYGAASDYHGQSKMQSAVCINHQQQKSFVKSDPLYK
uniref:Protein kinase domain-containing protein n=1 Tax=Parascaris univalens TaxID=6257 RepID=A0A915CKF4_PARUN